MAGEWFVMNNPMAGYIVARVRDTSKVVHSGNLEYHGEYTDDKEECQRIVDELNKKEGENNVRSVS